MDEQWGYVGAKSRQRWLFYAYDRLRKTVVAHVFGERTAGHQRYLCSHCRKTWQLQFTYTASQPGTHQKIIDMAMNGVGCRATARIMGVGLNTIFRHLKNSGRSR
ncbi:hypothetical protein AWP86_05270 [Escherichia coli]|nr:hypothetical protein AWP86_05270 [Escherichia coli]